MLSWGIKQIYIVQTYIRQLQMNKANINQNEKFRSLVCIENDIEYFLVCCQFGDPRHNRHEKRHKQVNKMKQITVNVSPVHLVIKDQYKCAVSWNSV